MQPRDLEAVAFSPSDLVRSRETVELAVNIFASMLKVAGDDLRLESFVRRTIADMIEVGRITPTNNLYVDIINPFYKGQFGEDAPAFVVQRVTYRTITTR